jgi:hypothetical protein
MDGMRFRLEIKNLHLKVGNVSHDGQHYVLFSAYDDTNNEIVLEITHEQAGWLEDQFYNANRRWEEQISTPDQSQPNLQPYNFGYNNPHTQAQGNQYQMNQEQQSDGNMHTP